MAWVISVLGAVLAVAGGIALWNGSGYIRLDWGQAETVAGTVALSSGILTIAVAAVLFALRDLARRSARPATSGVGLDAVHLAEAEDAPQASTRGRVTGRLATLGLPKGERAVPETEDLSARDRGGPVAAGSLAHPEPVLAEPEPVLDPRPRAVPEAPPPVVPLLAEAPTVVGRYEANGASYVLFSDGTIEVETQDGTHRFASMAALKEHIERQDAV